MTSARRTLWPTFLSAKSRKSLIWGVASSVSGGRRTPLSQRRNWAKKPTETNLVTSLIYYPKCKLCLDSSLIGHPKPKFFLSCQFFANVLVLYLKNIKSACFGHFLHPISMRPPCAWILMCFFLSCYSVLCQFYY